MIVIGGHLELALGLRLEASCGWLVRLARRGLTGKRASELASRLTWLIISMQEVGFVDTNGRAFRVDAS